MTPQSVGRSARVSICVLALVVTVAGGCERASAIPPAHRSEAGGADSVRGRVIDDPSHEIAAAAGEEAYPDTTRRAGGYGGSGGGGGYGKPLPRQQSKRPPFRAASIEDGIEIYFSPEGGATEAIIREIQRARYSVLVEAFAFTSVPIARALVEAQDRGVIVAVLLDENRTMAKNSVGHWLFERGVPVFIDNQHANAHSKIIIIDRSVIMTGSFNFTKSAEENNAENLLILRDKPKLIKAYLKNFDQHFAHSVPYPFWWIANNLSNMQE